MSKIKIFESVPNISEGRAHSTIEEFANLIKNIPEIELLDYSSDKDHHRSVFTFIGTEKAIIEANFVIVQKALEKIDLNKHSGVHPRVGAVDVIPIVPVLNATMTEAVNISRLIAVKIEKKLHIPTILYANSAEKAEYRNLANIRRQKYNIKVHRSAGAISVGARDFLVAYNINLNTQDIEIAKKIADEIRTDQQIAKNRVEGKYTLPDVKAIGLYLKGLNCVQVSMNLVNPLVIGRKDVYQIVSQLADRFHVDILGEELIGLEPEQVIEKSKELCVKIENKE